MYFLLKLFVFFSSSTGSTIRKLFVQNVIPVYLGYAIFFCQTIKTVIDVFKNKHFLIIIQSNVKCFNRYRLWKKQIIKTLANRSKKIRESPCVPIKMVSTSQLLQLWSSTSLQTVIKSIDFARRIIDYNVAYAENVENWKLPKTVCITGCLSHEYLSGYRKTPFFKLEVAEFTDKVELRL